jgi:hypothetical protein
VERERERERETLREKEKGGGGRAKSLYNQRYKNSRELLLAVIYMVI